MDYDQARNMAVRVAKSFSSLQMPFEDRVQECLLKWCELKDAPVPNNYIFIAMKNRMIEIMRKEASERRAMERLDPPSPPPTPETIVLEKGESVVAIPRQMRITRKFLLLLVESNMDLGEACRRAKVTYDRGRGWWRKAKKIARQMAEKGWDEEDVLIRVENSSL